MIEINQRPIMLTHSCEYEFIAVGCVPPASVAISVSVQMGVSAQGMGVCWGGGCVLEGSVCQGVVCLEGCLHRGCLPGGMSAQADTQADTPPPVNRMTGRQV